MLLSFAKKKPSKEEEKAASQQRPLHEYIPYYGHFNDHTLITKNGELLQVIKIASNNQGLNYESGVNSDETVRALIRSALQKFIATDEYAVCVHTLRKRKPVSFASHYNNAFAAHVHEQWQQNHRFKHQFYNEIYITILFEGQVAKLTEIHNLSSIVSLRRHREFRNHYLDTSYKKLNDTVLGIMQSIGSHYQARRLAIVERIPEESTSGRGIFYSEPLEFLNTLANLRDEEVVVSDIDASQMIAPHSLQVGFNAIETKDAFGARRFAALLSLKQYRELPPETADRILQAPLELIVSQNFNFTHSIKALKDYKEQKWLFGVSGDTYSEEASGLNEMLSENRNLATDFGQQQTVIVVIVDEYKSLDHDIHLAQQAFTEIGLITIREDIKMEECFWSILPGNFEFVRRGEFIAFSKIAGLCRLNRFPSGNYTNLHWNEPLLLAPTSVHSPYFLNFHHHDNGHTLWFDFNSFRDQAGLVTLDFLLTTSLKYKGHIYVFDRRQSSKLFASKLQAPYQRFITNAHKAGKKTPRLNPFSLQDDSRNRAFLLAWSMSLFDANVELSTAQKDTLRSALEQLFSQPPESRSLKSFASLVRERDAELALTLSDYVESGPLGGLFDAAGDEMALNENFIAYDIDRAAANPRLLVPLFSYLMHRIILSLDGKPTIIVMHEAWDLLENSFFAPRLESLLDMLRQHNAMVIATTSNPHQTEGTKTLESLMASCATRIYIPDDLSMDYTSEALGLRETDSTMLRRMQRNMGDLIIRQASESIGLRLNLDHAEDVRAIYAGDIKNLIAAGGKFASIPKDD